MEEIITRFPPSPTGYLHVGGARTALFNWLYARHTGGKFVLRIEDTDTRRSTQASVDAIFDAMKWLDIDWDDGPYFQTQRFDIYAKYVEQLIETGHAYYCDCTPEEVDEMRKRGLAANGKAKYDGTCREKGLARSENTVVRFKAPVAGTTVLEDIVKGNIVFQNADLDDFIIQRSDGTPTYNFVVVIDDMTMGINTIIRGDDHVSNTPKQIMLYKALGAALPRFAHVPMVLGKDKARLSKRHGAMSVTEYRKMGFLPDAFINYMVRLGWSCGDQEFFTREELIEKFSLDHIGKSAGVFDPDKLTALNADHIKAMPPEKLIPHLMPFLEEQGIDATDTDYLIQVIGTLAARSKTLVEMAEAAGFYYRDVIEYEEKAAKKFLKPGTLEPLQALAEALETLEDFTEKGLEGAFLAVMEKTGLKLGKIAQPVRVALTGKTASPGIFEIIEILGKESTLDRIKAAIRFISEKN
ncbi:glutamate--tRNA ligase [Desulfonema ishimotonii]|uniref:Glutamate--tRNA ligase n=1 Tax=Desulfonema ishimotonii TaxID=45657 RepID=A0A401FWW8_9BACT|nr:glutamate--tRNA ligase [Desulfonema ishimotonii]GBC61477.1 glutamate--tRNA ligase [Desulfonema ishimotonii]